MEVGVAAGPSCPRDYRIDQRANKFGCYPALGDRHRVPAVHRLHGV
jgi:hypothetical protein